MRDDRPRDRWANVRAARARYWDEGEESLDPPVVLLHGIGMSVESWRPTVEALCPRFRVIAVDQLGFGRTDKPSGPYDPVRVGTFVVDFLQTLGIERIHLVGHSMGGAVSAGIAGLRPSLVERLVLVAPGGVGRSIALPFRLMTIPGLGRLMSRPNRTMTKTQLQACAASPEAIPEEVVDACYHASSSPGARQAMISMIRSSLDLRGVSATSRRESRAILRKIEAPTLCIWGRSDPVLPPGHAEIVRKHLTDSDILYLDDCGHFPQLEKPDQVDEALLQFLSLS